MAGAGNIYGAEVGPRTIKKYIKKQDSMLERSPEVKAKLFMLTELLEALTR